MTENEKIEFDILFVGGGPACLAGAVLLGRLAREAGKEIEIALIEKGDEIGAHSLGGSILNPVALESLLPDYRERGFPEEAIVKKDKLCLMTRGRAFCSPFIPPEMENRGYSVVSLSVFTRWLADIALEMGVSIFPGFAGKSVLWDGKKVAGVRTGDKGTAEDGSPLSNFEPGMDIMAGATIFGEGARGSLTKDICLGLGLDAGKMPQVYETGIKEVIRLPEDESRCESIDASTAFHTLGYPLGPDVPGGGFLYPMKKNLVSLGFLTGLSYSDPFLNLYETFTRFKQHPFIAGMIRGGSVIEQGARTVSTGGWYTMPGLSMDGAMLVGGGAAIHNGPALKGIHLAMASGMMAAGICFQAFLAGDFSAERLGAYERLFRESRFGAEIFRGRNFTGALLKKSPLKWIYSGARMLNRGRGIRDPLPITEDADAMTPKKNRLPGPPPSYDDFFVDPMTGVYLSKIRHRENQPVHLLIKDPEICVSICHETYGCPCTRFCPGKVYEIDEDPEKGIRLNPANCLHCKTCDIKDPFHNIVWTCPEGGSGPGYTIV